MPDPEKLDALPSPAVSFDNLTDDERMLADALPRLTAWQRLAILRYARNELLERPEFLWALIMDEAVRRSACSASAPLDCLPRVVADLGLQLTTADEKEDG